MRKRVGFFFFIFALLLSSNPKERENQVVKVFRRAGPAVVSIRALRVVKYKSPLGLSKDWFWSDFFDDFWFGPEVKTEEESIGSGVIIDASGYVLTNYHVIEGAEQIEIILQNGEKYQARVVGADTRSDLAVLKINPQKPLAYLPMGTSSDLMIGETVIAIGNPFGLGPTLTVGVVSALHRKIKIDDRVYGEFIQTDASINPGNSGGALLNIVGELIGITTAIYAKAQGIGFAIPIDKAKRIVDDLIKFGEVHPGWLGIEVKDISGDLRHLLGLGERQGVLVDKVWQNSPAQKAGIKAGAIIVQIDNKPITSSWDYKDCLSEITVGDEVRIKYIDEGREKLAVIKARDFPEKLAPKLCWKLLGIEPKETKYGVLIYKVDPTSPAGKMGLGTGDVIVRLGNQSVYSLRDFYQQLIKNRNQQSISMVIKRENFYYYLTLPLRG